MAELKTQRHDGDVEAFMSSIADEARQADARAVCAMMQRATGQEPTMWGASIVGFGTYAYRYASGRTGEWMAVGFSPRKANTTVYINEGFGRYADLLARLGPHSTGASCLYLKRLSDVDVDVLEDLVAQSYREILANPPSA